MSKVQGILTYDFGDHTADRVRNTKGTRVLVSWHNTVRGGGSDVSDRLGLANEIVRNHPGRRGSDNVQGPECFGTSTTSLEL